MKRRYFLLLILCVFSSVILAQHQDKVDFEHANVSIQINPDAREVIGEVVYDFKVLDKVDSVFLDAQNIDFSSVRLNNKKVSFNNNGQTISIFKKFKKGKTYALTLEYKAKPKQTVYFVGYEDDIDGNEQIWTQGQGKYTSHWLPSFDDMTEKVEFDLDITFDKEFAVIANGKLTSIESQEPEALVWRYDMQKPMSSYLLAFAIGNYSKQVLTSSSGVPIENYFYPQDSLRVEPTYRYTKEIFDFLEQEIGVPYPWQDYKQVPVHDFLYAGMENTGATIFSDAYVIDSTAFIDKNYVNVNAHELAHQWFGNLVTEKDGNQHWLHEGFATYYAYLAEKKIYGEDHFYWKLYDTAEQLQSLSEEGKGEALTNPKASSLTFYEKGAWALVMLRDLVGDEPFKEGVRNFLWKHQFKNVTIADFLEEIELVSNQELGSFSNIWLQSTEFPWEAAKTFMMTKNHSIRVFFVSKHLNKSDLSWLKEDQPVQYIEELLREFEEEMTEFDFIALLTHPELKIRRNAMQLLEKIPDYLKEYAEKLLDDKSYITQEMALYNLWVSFPGERNRYLDQTMTTIGLPNKNVRLLWLTLALITPEYNSDQQQTYLVELNSYTSPEYNFEVRQLAFQYLHQISALNDVSITNLIVATEHHSWQFRKFARNLLDDLLKDDEQRKRLTALSKGLNEDEFRYINTKLN